MKTSSQTRIAAMTSKGWWGTDTLHGLLAKAVASSPNKIAVADQPNREELTGSTPRRLTYVELDLASDRLAQQLLSNGVTADDILIVQLPNITELVVTYHAASKIGAILSPIPVQFARHELSTIATVLDSKLFITTSHFKGQPLATEALNNGATVFCFGEEPPTGAIPLSIDNAVHCEILNNYRAEHADVIDDANRIITICWTSGTTGTPKGVPRSHNMWLATVKAEIGPCDYQPGDNFLNPFPLVNMAAVGGFLFPCVLMAGSLFLHHPLEPNIYLQQLQDEQINFTIAPPTLLNLLAKSEDMWNQFDFSALRRVGSGSAPLAPWMIEIFSKKYGKEVTNFYGSNEGICLLSNVETAADPEQRAHMFPRLGYEHLPWKTDANTFTKTKVVDLTTGEEITEAGHKGELLIAGPTIFDAYFTRPGQPAVNADAFTEDGFYRTGDLVEICGDPAYYYKIVGRCKDVINRGGMKISPVEIDLLLESMETLQDVAVCAYPDERLGERICACVVPKADVAPPSLEDICAHLNKAGIAKFKLPERIEIFERLPRNAMGKVLRYQLVEQVSV
ncbi:class I adenylate-forming enzyme family protein [Pseudidiomarina sediminum]|uniref:class I adenylate-forming enzyme family protein n=1 Tax=Pseudidiomarina sediminum TaxID=431675 RepID=UPI001C945439|nr:class I adenylate-forming enzyme family protein [Pseudidiomarina sediminum]MBY6062711.1 acyl--CoA ligase [Pseudidiomarina sediminum]